MDGLSQADWLWAHEGLRKEGAFKLRLIKYLRPQDANGSYHPCTVNKRNSSTSLAVARAFGELTERHRLVFIVPVLCRKKRTGCHCVLYPAMGVPSPWPATSMEDEVRECK